MHWPTMARMRRRELTLVLMQPRWPMQRAGNAIDTEPIPTFELVDAKQITLPVCGFEEHEPRIDAGNLAVADQKGALFAVLHAHHLGPPRSRSQLIVPSPRKGMPPALPPPLMTKAA